LLKGQPTYHQWGNIEDQFAGTMIVFDEKILGFNMLGALGTQNMAIFSQGEGTYIILIDIIGGDGIALGFKKIASPKDITSHVKQANNFSFSRTFCVQFLFNGRTGHSITTEC
jgi:hypothetical protein